MKPVTYNFYCRYFLATRDASWLARLLAGYRLKMLNDLMQWDVNGQVSESR
ncbi:glucose uptake inhibitor SgrT [uncultured Pluralibacter sp.]|uniref:glucose uptake inhibitor SgrT n=1 Tax=uncultured Pluralibacter sp. TaxID=1490864 RepID=UPI0026067BB3|nr:glucose uptake inhibitor SgrT [uncultured Pluralibacter sp.]